MSDLKLLLLIIIVITFTTGCPTQPSKNLKNKDTLAANVNEYLVTQQGRYNCALDFGKNYDASTGTCGTTDITNADSFAQRVRNDSIEDALAVIDSNYTDFITNLDSRRSKWDFIADVIDLGAGAATGISKGERPNQILGIALTAFRGGRRSVELDFYKQQTTPILIAKMDDNRSKAYAAMLTKKARPVSQYSMKEAIRDIVNYYNAGTLIRAFADLAKDTSAQARDSENVVRELKGENITVSNIPTLKHSSISDEVFAIRVSLAKQLAAAQTAAEAIPIPMPADPANPTAAETTAKATAEAARAAEFADIRLKYDTIWKDIEGNERFAPFVTQMKTDPDLSAIFAKLAANRADVTADEFDLLLTRFTALVSRASKETKNTDQFEELLQLLRRAGN